GQGLRQRAADLRHRDLRRRILRDQPFPEQIPVESSEARQLPGGRPWLRAAFDSPRDVLEHVRTARSAQLYAALLEALVERQQVRAIRSERILRQSPLHPDGIEEPIDQRFRIPGQRGPCLRRCGMQKVVSHLRVATLPFLRLTSSFLRRTTRRGHLGYIDKSI